MFAQSVVELESRLDRAPDNATKMRLCFQLAEKTLSSSPSKAATYANRAAEFAAGLNDKVTVVQARLIHGKAYEKQGDANAAITRYKLGVEAGKDAGAAGLSATVECLGKLRDLAVKNRDYKSALDYSQQAIDLLQQRGGGSAKNSDKKANAQSEQERLRLEAEKQQLVSEISQLARERDQYKTGFSQKTEELAKTKTESEKAISSKEQALSSLEEEKKSLDALKEGHERMIADLTKEQIADSLLISQKNNELKKQELDIKTAQLEKRKNEYLRNILLILAAFGLLLAGLIYARYRAKKRSEGQLQAKNKEIEIERKRSDDLLLNILPPAIAAELKANGRAMARKYDQTTVMFVDFVNFTRMAELLSPEALVEELDYCFRQFDAILSQFNVEKIKTIGDAYMCANGLSDRNALPDDMIKSALEMQQFLTNLKLERHSRGLPYFEARIGIHTGPVVAGVVGAKKFAYDIWGDTVNMAARMEQACTPGRVNVSATTHELSKYMFQFEERGQVAAKNKGDMEMFYVIGRYY